jgi:hypothetical protein
VEVHLFRQAEAVPANLNELARGDKRFDVPLERRAIVSGNLEDLQKLAHARRVVHALAHE